MPSQDLTSEEVAARLKVEQAHVRRLCIDKIFPNAYKRANSWFIPAADVEAYEQNRPKPGPKPKK